MNKKRIKIFVSLLLGVVILSASLVLVFNLFMASYIDDEAVNALELDSKLYVNNMRDIIIDDSYIESLFTTSALYTDNDFSIEHSEYEPDIFFEKDYYLIRQCKLHEDVLREGTIVMMNVLNERYYVKLLPVKDDAAMVLLLYVNVAPMQRLIGRINIVMGVVVVILASLIGWFGLQAGKRLEDSESKMKRFFQNASHELKTPIMNIQGYAEGIEQGVLNDHVKAARTILSESDRMTDLVNEILELSKMESGTVELNLTRTDVGELLYECLERVQPIADKKNINFDVHIKENVIALCDSNLLEKVFLNILSNAMRYAQREIDVRLLDECEIVIKIANDGDRLAKEDAKHVFDRFYCGAKGSTGVGMALSKEIVEMHKGNISVEVEPKTCFEVMIPKR